MFILYMKFCYEKQTEGVVGGWLVEVGAVFMYVQCRGEYLTGINLNIDSPDELFIGLYQID